MKNDNKPECLCFLLVLVPPRPLGSVLKVCVCGCEMLWPKASPLDFVFVLGPSLSIQHTQLLAGMGQYAQY